MACVNHPEVISGLDKCTACGKSFCIDCLVGRKAGWFCSACDTEGKPVAAAVPAGAAPARPLAPARAAVTCFNHKEVLERLNRCSTCAEHFCPDCLLELKGKRYCAVCKADAVKNIQSGVEAGGLQLAGFGARLAALLIDNFVTGGIMMVFFVIMGVIMAVVQPGPDSMAVPILVFAMYGVVFAAMFCYHGFMLQWKGQTLGKMAVKIKVVTPEGGPITPGQAWVRVLVWFLLHGCLIDYIPAFFNDEKMAIHDMAAKTRVVKIG